MTDKHAIVPIDEMLKLAGAIARSGLFGMKTPDQALALMAIAQAEGRHPALAARDYSIIQGRPAKNAEAMMRDFLESGGKVEWHRLDDEKADATFSHPAGGSARIEWDLERARRAGLGGKANWKQYPRQMLRSRVVSEGVRTVCPMATSGMYVPEEVQEFEPREPKDVTPPNVPASNGMVPDQIEQKRLVPRRPRAAERPAVTSAASDLSDGLSDIGKAELEPADIGEDVSGVRADFRDLALSEADKGSDSFKAWWRGLTRGNRDLLRPELTVLQERCERADARGGDPEPEPPVEDPFGLPPLPQEERTEA